MNGASGRGSGGDTFRAGLMLHLHGLERSSDAAIAGAPDSDPPDDLLRCHGPEGDALELVPAMAPFAPERLEITALGDQLSISGEGTGDGDPGRVLHRGIAGRRFSRAFRPAPGLDVVGAAFDRGLLSITLASRAADRTCRRIAIGSPSV